MGLDGLSVIIPSRDRQAALLRQVRVWQGSSARVYLLDNGKDPLPDQVRRQLPPNIVYEHRPGRFHEQLEAVNDLIDTPYAMYCDDDNLLLPPGLGACLEILEADASLAFSWGRTAKFLTFVGKVYVAESYQRASTAFAESDDPALRVREHLSTYQPSAWYAVHRTESFRKLNSAAAHLLRTCSSGYAAEMCVEASAFFNGPARQTSHVALLRSLENRPLDQASTFRRLGFSQWLNSPDYGYEVNVFNSVVLQLCSGGIATPEDASEVLEILRLGPGSPSVAGGRVSVNEAAQSLPHWLLGNVAVRRSLNAGSRVRGSVSWWWSTTAEAEAACLLARAQGRPGRVVRARAWEPDTVVDWQAIEELPW